MISRRRELKVTAVMAPPCRLLSVRWYSMARGQRRLLGWYSEIMLLGHISSEWPRRRRLSSGAPRGALVVEDTDVLERRHRERMEARKARQEERLKMQQSIRQATLDDDGLDAPEGILVSLY